MRSGACMQLPEAWLRELARLAHGLHHFTANAQAAKSALQAHAKQSLGWDDPGLLAPISVAYQLGISATPLVWRAGLLPLHPPWRQIET